MELPARVIGLGRRRVCRPPRACALRPAASARRGMLRVGYATRFSAEEYLSCFSASGNAPCEQ